MTPQQKFIARTQAADMTKTRGIAQAPQSPRDITCQAAPRGIFLTWALPSGFNSDIVRWRVYKNDESTLFTEIADRGTRQCFVETTAGSSPPVTNIFVSSINNLGVESQKVQVQGTAAVEAGAPTMPGVPPGYNSGSGYNKNGGYGYGKLSLILNNS